MADTGWVREDYGGSKIFFTRKGHGETTICEDDGELWIEINDHWAGQGCGHTVAVTAEMLAALGYERKAKSNE